MIMTFRIFPFSLLFYDVHDEVIATELSRKLEETRDLQNRTEKCRREIHQDLDFARTVCNEETHS
jgi:hypothetical protein